MRHSQSFHFALRRVLFWCVLELAFIIVFILNVNIFTLTQKVFPFFGATITAFGALLTYETFERRLSMLDRICELEADANQKIKLLRLEALLTHSSNPPKPNEDAEIQQLSKELFNE